MKILHIINSLNDGGAEGVLYRLATYDKNNEHFIVSLMAEGKYFQLLTNNGIKVINLNMPRGKITLTGIWGLFHFIKTQQPDAIQTWLYHSDFIGGLVSFLAGKKNIYWGIRHNNLNRCTSKFGTIVVAKICAYLSRWIPKKIVCCSHEAAKAHIAFGYRADKISVIPNGYDLDKFTPDINTRKESRNRINISKKQFLLGMVARFDIIKDHKNLLAALGIVNKRGINFYCLLAGTGIDASNKELSELIDKESIRDNLILLGRQDNIHLIMNMLDVHILSSSDEAFPNVLAEAMACGIPCISTDVGDASSILGNTGWIVKKQNPAALASAIIEARNTSLNNNSWQNRKIEARSRIIENYSIENMVAEYNRIWKEKY